MKAFLMLGQSNMAGRGRIGEVPAVYDPRCFMLRNGTWVPMTEPINPDAPVFGDLYGDLHSGISLAASFAKAYAEAFSEEIGLIPCAHGGTGLEAWTPGGVLFDHAVLQTRLAMRTSELAGILWHQGENDSADENSARLHGERLTAILRALFRALGVDGVPVLLGGLGEFLKHAENGSLRYYTVVNAGLRRLAQTLPETAFVSAEALSCNPDGVHFDAAACRTFGLRYFTAYRKLTGR